MTYRFQINVGKIVDVHEEIIYNPEDAIKRAKKILAETKRDYHTDYAHVSVHKVSYEFVGSYC